MAAEPISLAPGGGMSIDNAGGGVITFKASAEQTGGALTALETVVDPGWGPPLHVHRDQDEFIHVVDGRFRVRLGEELIEAAAGAFVFIPRGTPHTWQNVDEVPRRLFAGVLPAAPALELFFVRLAALASEERDASAFAGLAADTEAIEVLGPPLAVSD